MKVAILATDNREQHKDYQCPRPYFGTAPEALFQGFAALPEVEVHIISCVRQPLKPTQVSSNIWHHPLYVPKFGWMSTFYQGCIRATRKKLSQIRPDIVHGQGTERECAMGAVFSGYPNVLTIHGNMAELARLFKMRIGSYGWLAARLENFALRKTAGTFCNSSYTRKLVAPRTPKTWLVPNAIRSDFFLPPTTATPTNNRPIFLNVGLVSPRKRQLELLDLAARLHAAGNSFALHFIGDICGNDYGRAFLKKIQPMEKAGFVRHIGRKNTAELIQCFDQSQALIHFPSEEAFGLVVAEALARNLKFFGSRVGGIADITSDVPGAELFEVEDWSGLEAGISRWLQLGMPRSHATQTLISTRYHPQQVAQRHIEIYCEVLSRT